MPTKAVPAKPMVSRRVTDKAKSPTKGRTVAAPKAAAGKKVAASQTFIVEVKKPRSVREFSEGELELLATIRRQMGRLEMTQGDVADALSKALGKPFSRAAVGKWVRNEATPNLKQQVALANLWGMSMDDLYGRPTALSAKAEIDRETLQGIDDALFRHLQSLCKGTRSLATYAKVRTPFLTLHPDLLMEDDSGPLLTIFIMQGNYNDMVSVVGTAYAWREAKTRAPMFLAWINHGDALPDFSPMCRQGLLGGVEVVTAEQAVTEAKQGTVFLDLRSQLTLAVEGRPL